VTWLLDSDACIFLIKGREPLLGRVSRLSPDDFAVSSITCAELWFGAARSEHPQRSRKEQDALLGALRVVDFDVKAANHYASVGAHLARAGRRIGERDLMIASIALAQGMAVITSNTREFRRVPSLRVEDWMSEG
jgi:tRNA(fMet)-specific endonuclease VapC